MVRLRRGPPPALLLRKGAEWTDRWLAIHGCQRTGDWATPTAKQLLYDELRRLAHGKCAFCESLLDLTSYLEIEHHTAKTIRPDLAFSWENLFPVCRLCNNSKAATDHAGLLLKPDAEDPESLLWLNPDSGNLEASKAADAASRLRIGRSIELCDLQRGVLCTKRIDIMMRTIHWLERVSTHAGVLDAKLQREWKHLIDPATEYKFVIRHTFITRGEPRLAAMDRARFEAGA